MNQPRSACWRGKSLLLLVCYSLLKGSGAEQLFVSCPLYRSQDSIILHPTGSYKLSSSEDAALSADYQWSGIPSSSSFVNCSRTSQPLSDALAGGTCLPTFNVSAAAPVKLCSDGEQLFLTVAGKDSVLDLPAKAKVSICKSKQHPLLLLWQSNGDAGQILLAKTGCIAVWANDTAWVQGSKTAIANPSSSYAEAAGFPSDALQSAIVTSFSVQDQSNPCTATDDGFSVGLTSQYYAKPNTSSQATKLLSFGSPNFARCDCPNHQAAGEPWAGSPQLPRSYVDNFGAGFSGEFLAIENDLGGDLASWKLVCLQYNGVAQLLVDGILLISPDQKSPGGAGYAEICTAMQLDEGWHNVNLLYAIGPQNPVSVARFFLIDAVGPYDASNSTVYEEAIEWRNDASLCPVGDEREGLKSCNEPYGCCNFRTSYGCGSGSVLQDDKLPQSPPIVLAPSPVQYSLPAFSGFGRGGFPGMGSVSTPITTPVPARQTPAPAPQESGKPPKPPAASRTAPPKSAGATSPSRSNAQPPPKSTSSQQQSSASPPLSASGPLQPSLLLPSRPQSNARAPVQLQLPLQSPPPVGFPACRIDLDPCWLYQEVSTPQMRTASFSCSTAAPEDLQYTAGVEYRTGTANDWLSVSPTSGTLNTASELSFMLTVDFGELAYGEYYAALEVTWQNAAGQSAIVTRDIVLVLAGVAETRFERVLPLSSSDTAQVAAVASLELPITGTIVTTNATLSSAEEKRYFAFRNTPFDDRTGPIEQRITSNITLPSQYADPAPVLALEVAFEVALPLSEYSASSCGKILSDTRTTINIQPQCQLFAVDMAFCSRRGLVTSRTEAQLVLACTTQVAVCADCFVVSGPQRATTEILRYATESDASTVHHILLSWPAEYSGPVIINVQNREYAPGCGLKVMSAASNFTEALIAAPLQFTVEDALPIRSAAYEVLHECSGQQCTFDL